MVRRGQNRLKPLIFIFIIILLSLSVSLAYGYSQKAPPIAGIVTKVIDGDTIDARLANNETVRIRFTLANTPERSSIAGWLPATTFTKTMCPVGTAIIMDPDAGQPKSFHRNVAKVFCLHAFLQNDELVKNGYAVINRSKYCPMTEFKAEAWTGCTP